MSELKSWVWPGVSGRRQIRFAILEGYCAAIAVGLAFGIERRSRTAAVAALSIYVLNSC